MAQPVKPITIKGRFFWKGDDRFVVNGVVYQPGHGTLPRPDPLDDNGLDDLRRSIPLFKELGINTLLVYFVDTANSRDTAMKLLADAGIYVLPCLVGGHFVINRASPFQSYTSNFLRNCFRAVDTMKQYSNTLGFIVSVEVINSIPTSAGAPVVRAVVRDVKRYVALNTEKGQRSLPIGITVMDFRPSLKLQFEYFCGGDEKEAVDFITSNVFSWDGKATMETSGYNDIVEIFSGAPVPVFFSEYGRNTLRPRLFQETHAIYTDISMLLLFSGGIVYEFFEYGNKFGLVRREEDPATGQVTLRALKDFKNLKKNLSSSFAKLFSHPLHDPVAAVIGSKGEFANRLGTRPGIPRQNVLWSAEERIPKSPIDWDELARQAEDDSEWVDVTNELYKMTVEDGQDSIGKLTIIKKKPGNGGPSSGA
ncbi:glycolipid anchored surface protein [Hypoxylon crocopeplum]|nr:glycolipid anchored surface protein [Hypoxylon crocopeplum]